MLRTALLIATIAAIGLPTDANAQCTVCHSRDPKMVRMHSAQGFKDCFDCHGPTAKPMDRDKRSEDPRCMPCHKN